MDFIHRTAEGQKLSAQDESSGGVCLLLQDVVAEKAKNIILNLNYVPTKTKNTRCFPKKEGMFFFSERAMQAVQCRGLMTGER